MCNVGYKLTMDGKRCLGKVSFSFFFRASLKGDLNTGPLCPAMIKGFVFLWRTVRRSSVTCLMANFVFRKKLNHNIF